MKARILIKNRFLDGPDLLDYALAAIASALLGLATAPDAVISRILELVGR